MEETSTGSTASLSAVNVVSADGWRSRYYPGVTFYSFVFDPQGNVVQKQYGGNTTNAPYSTASFEAYGKRDGEYDNFGETPAHHEDPSGFGGEFGYYTDLETGLLCLTHRYYDPGTGKFLTRDPIGYGGGMNLYGYADGNPVNEQDENGTQPKSPIVLGGPPTADPYGNPINLKKLYWHKADKFHLSSHYDYDIPRVEGSTNPLEMGIRSFRYEPFTGQWKEKEASVKSAATRVGYGLNSALNAARHRPGGLNSNAAKFDVAMKYLEEAFRGSKMIRGGAKVVGEKIDGLNVLLFLIDVKTSGYEKAVGNLFYPFSLTYANGRAEGIFEVAGPEDMPTVRR